MGSIEWMKFQMSPMKNQRNLLTALGCSGSAALLLSFATPASATPMAEIQNTDPLANPIVQADSNPIQDALGCGCATCQMSQMSSF